MFTIHAIQTSALYCESNHYLFATKIQKGIFVLGMLLRGLSIHIHTSDVLELLSDLWLYNSSVSRLLTFEE